MTETRHPHNATTEAEPRSGRELVRDEPFIRDQERFWQLADRIRERTRGRPQVPSEVLLRESRDER